MIDRKKQDVQTLVLGALLSLVGSGIFFTMPGYLGSLASVLHLRSDQIGLISGAENVAIGLSGLVTSLLQARVNMKFLAIAAMACAIGIILSGLTSDFHTLLAYRFLTGLGEGPLYTMSYIVLGTAANPDRAFGVALTATVGVSAAVLAAPASLLDRFGTNALLLPTVFAALLLLPALRWLPNQHGSEAEHGIEPENRSYLWQAGILLGMAIWFAAPGLFWAFAETSALARGVPDATIGSALSLATLTSLIGPTVPALMGDRLGRFGPLLLCTVGIVLSAALYPATTGLTCVSLSLSVFNICWTAATVYQMALMVSEVESRRLAGLAAIAQLAGIAAGSLVGGYLIGSFGYAVVPLCVGAITALGTVVFLKSVRSSSRTQSETSDEFLFKDIIIS